MHYLRGGRRTSVVIVGVVVAIDGVGVVHVVVNCSVVVVVVDICRVVDVAILVSAVCSDSACRSDGCRSGGSGVVVIYKLTPLPPTSPTPLSDPRASTSSKGWYFTCSYVVVLVVVVVAVAVDVVVGVVVVG